MYILEVCLVATAFFWVFVFVYTRANISMVLDHLLNRSNVRKRRKGQSFLDWFFYRRFKDVVPKRYLVWYYSNFVIYFLCIAMTIIFGLTGFEREIIRTPFIVVVIENVIVAIVIDLFWTDWKHLGKSWFGPDSLKPKMKRSGRNKQNKKWLDK